MDTLIHNVTLYTNDHDSQQTILTDHAVAIQGTRIQAIGKTSVLQETYQGYTQINGQGKLLMPGLINTHMHFYSTFARGIALNDTPQDFVEILSMLWWKLDRTLNAESVYYSALVPAITAIKKGITSIIDHHASPNAVEGSLDQIEKALLQAGLRGVLCYEVSDRDGKEIAQQGLVENERFIQKCQTAKAENPDHLLDAMIGLHASFTLGNDTLQEAGRLSQKLQKGCHIHLGEDPQDLMLTRKKYKTGLVERLQNFDILGDQTIAAHCIHLLGVEKDALAESNTMVVHNPQSNMNNAVGRTDILSFLHRNVCIGIGTDGMCADIKPDVKTALWLQKHDLHNNNIGWQEIETMTLQNNPVIMERVSGQKVGKIVPGYLADLILIDYYPPTPLTSDNFWGHFLFGISDADVDTTIINGKVLMANKQLLTLDEQQVAREAQKHAQAVWDRFR